MPNTITTYHTFSPDTKARSSEVNTNFSNHRGDLIPINENTVSASDVSHDLGTSDHRWKTAYIENAQWKCGDVKMHHSYNGRCSAGQGWMLCDGRQITEANYNTEHGAGSWATYIGSSTLSGLYLPDMDSRYPVGVDATSQGGTTTVTTVGNASHQINIQHSHTINNHTHTIPSHNHQWHNETSAGANDQTYNSGGSATDYASGTAKSGIKRGIEETIASGNSGPTDGWTDNHSGDSTGNPSNTGMNNQLSTTQSIQPQSIQYQFYMRII